MTKRIPGLRPLVQGLFFLGFLYLLFRAAFPLEIRFPVDLYLRLDPFIGLVTLLTQKDIFFRMLPGFGVLALVAIFGNFFCAWFCPMGTTIDVFDRILFREKKRAKPLDDQPLRRLRYGVFLFSLAAALAGWQLLSLVDPLSLITRVFATFVFPASTWVYNNLVVGAVGLLSKGSATLSAAPVPVFQAGFAILLFFGAVLSLSVVKKRFWCRYLCPLGTLFSLVSGLRLVRRSVTDDCSRCQRCVRSCPLAAIPADDPLSYRRSTCINCFKCLDCPPRAVSFRFNRGGAQPVPAVSMSRRYALGSLGLGLFAALSLKTSPLRGQAKLRNSRLIRPPGALPEDRFVAVCTGCGECLKVCPNNALQPAFLESGLEGIHTPRLVPRIGYCEENCNFCGQVCPTQAVRSLELEDKKRVQMGIAHIDKSRCIAHDTDKTCIVCNEQCSYRAVLLDDKKRPRVDEDKCTGCGICEYKCPVDGESAIVVHSTGIQKKLSPPAETQLLG
jgi:ferredoxin-type protein NapF